MIPIDEARLKLSDLRQAIDLEKKAHYIDLHGKKKRFSQFLAETFLLLEAFFPEDAQTKALKTAIGHYPYGDLTQRLHTLDKLTIALDSLSLAQTQTRLKTVMSSVVEQSPAEVDVKFVRGVGPKIAELLGKAQIKTAEDLLYYFPRKHLDYNQRLPIRQLKEGMEATVIGKITSVNAHQTKNRNLWIVSVMIADDTGSIAANWIFATAHRGMVESFKSRFAKGAEVMASGKLKWDTYKNKLAIDKPDLEILSYAEDGAEELGSNSLNAGRIVPIYPLVQGLNLRVLRRAIRHALDDFLPAMADPIPVAIRERYQLVDLQTAMEQLHFPETFYHYEAARKRLVFDELFFLQTRLALIRSQYKKNIKGYSLQMKPGGMVQQFLAQLPFALTNAQQRVFQEIQSDMASIEPMYRLLQGDVGSGKTILALLTLLIAVENGFQGALMAPTEILAEQHYRNCIQWLTPLGLKVGLFVGKQGARERRELQTSLLNGQIHIAVGTHALIQDAVEFQRLGSVVVDEQHRFGVRQRVLLKNKGDNPEMLTMTATPIPRTLAMTLHGDLDVSILDELPPGRSPIRTGLYKGKTQREQAISLIRSEIEKGRQAYIVFPLIEESETLSAKSATVEFERLKNEIFPHLRLGLLHGKLSSEEKEGVMQAFTHHQLDILVSTTVIEVGVDVPNSTVMLIENADRFGLAQLHQLRGRVGRGAYQSYCMLLTDSRTPETLERLKILESSTDGFYISEKDLELRGPGEFLGTRQSGLPDLVLADLIQDKEILGMAREAAFELVQQDNQLASYPELEEAVLNKTHSMMDMVNAG